MSNASRRGSPAAVRQTKRRVSGSWQFVPILVIATGLMTGCNTESAPKPEPVSDTMGSQSAASDSRETWFHDVTAESGVDITYISGENADRYTLLESLGGGIGLIDFDRDGQLDIVFPGGGNFERQGKKITGFPTRLFRNLGGWRFEDVSSAVGIDAPPYFYSHGCAVADYDRDGWPDLLVTGYGRLRLYHNVDAGGGARRFVDVTAQSGVASDSWSTSAAFGDVSGDGYPDLYLCHYADWSFDNDPVCEKPGTPHGRDVCPPQRFAPLADALYVNNGDGTFRDVTAEQNIRADGCGLGVVMVDLNGNGQPEVYVANDATPNFLYQNRDGVLNECGGLSGVAFDENGSYDGSMGVDAADFDGTRRPSLWVTNFQEENHALYANLGNGFFRHDSKAAGIAALGRSYVGFGTGFFDGNNDGWEDLVVVNGHVVRYPQGTSFRQRGVLLANIPRGNRRTFMNISASGGTYFEREVLGRGLAIGDLDNDGWPDLVISHSNEPVVLLRNTAAQSNDHHWLGVELVGKDQRDIVGSSVTVHVGDTRLVRYVKGGGSYLSSSDRRLLFGLGSTAAPVSVSVRWSWGATESWEGLRHGAYYRLREGEPVAERIEPRATPHQSDQTEAE